MNTQLTASQDAVRKARVATRYLIALSLGLMVALGGMFAHLSSRQNTLRDSIREDALWAVYQLDREARTLSESLHKLSGAQDDEARQTLALRYDILYSRLSILDNSQYAAFFEDNDSIVRNRALIREMVLWMQPPFNALAAGQAPSPALLAPVVETLPHLLQVTNDLLTYTNSSVSSDRAEAREEVMRLQRMSAMIVVALTLSIGLLVLNLRQQVAHVKKASVELENIAAKLSDAYSAAEAGNRAKSQFMATIGHEIRTPLNAILGMAELLGHARLEEEDKANVRVITSSGTALLEIINEILDFAKLEHGDTPPESVPFDARELVKDAMRVMDGRAREQGNELSCACATLGGDGWYLGDPARLRRVVLNLLSNAVKFTDQGKVVARVEEKRDGAGGLRLRFSVSDTGIGIPQDARHRLFNAFSQVDGTISRRYGGTGLGLAICKRIVEEMTGEIGVDSTPGNGSTFWFEVPAVATAASPAAPVATSERSDPLPILRILLVEDNLVNRQVAVKFLEMLNQSVEIAVDGEQAVRICSQDRFDLILMDMQMPVMDGIAATRAIRAAGDWRALVPIIAMTASASETDRSLCRDAGMSGFEAKPISSAKLAALIRAYGASGSSALPAHGTAGVGAPPNAAPAPDRDQSRVDELVEAVGREAFDALVEVFFADTSALLADLARAMKTHDFELFDRSLHSLKGSASNLGFVKCADLAEELRSARLSEVAVSRMAAEIARLSEERSACAA